MVEGATAALPPRISKLPHMPGIASAGGGGVGKRRIFSR
jgi:hypothetical protein